MLILVIYFATTPMKKNWLGFVAAAVAGAVLFSLPYEQRQEVAEYITMCLLLAFIIRPVGLTIGRILRKVLDKD